MHVCKKQINEILKKGVLIHISFFIFSPSLSSACLMTSLMVYVVKKPCRFGARMMLILTWRFAKLNRQNVSSLRLEGRRSGDINSYLLEGNYTTVNDLLGKTKCPKGKIAVYEEVVKTNKIITFRRFGDLMTPLSRNGNKLMALKKS